MKRVDTVLEIHATPERVWEVLTGFGDYPAWNPIIPSIRGGTTLGDRVAFRIRLEGLPELRLVARVVRSDRAREFAWAGGVRGVFLADHAFRLEPVGDSQTRLVHTETFAGVLPLAMGPLLGNIQRSYETLNRSLAARATSPSA